MLIVKYGCCNLSSIKNMLQRIGVDSIIRNKNAEIERSDKLILLGVDNFDYGMEQLLKPGLINLLTEKVIIAKTPIPNTWYLPRCPIIYRRK